MIKLHKLQEKNVVPARPTASIPAKKRTFEESSSVVEDDIFEALSPIISIDEFTCDSCNYLLNLKGPTPNYEKEKEVPKLNVEDGPRKAFKPLPPRRVSTNSTTNEPKAPSKGSFFFFFPFFNLIN